MRSYFLTPVSLHCLWHRREERERRKRQGGRKREGRKEGRKAGRQAGREGKCNGKTTRKETSKNKQKVEKMCLRAAADTGTGSQFQDNTSKCHCNNILINFFIFPQVHPEITQKSTQKEMNPTTLKKAPPQGGPEACNCTFTVGSTPQ
jgi:hypothetical protein